MAVAVDELQVLASVVEMRRGLVAALCRKK
jgi:hypothetical protein